MSNTNTYDQIVNRWNIVEKLNRLARLGHGREQVGEVNVRVLFEQNGCVAQRSEADILAVDKKQQGDLWREEAAGRQAFPCHRLL